MRRRQHEQRIQKSQARAASKEMSAKSEGSGFQTFGKKSGNLIRKFHQVAQNPGPNYLRLIKYPAKAALEKIQRNVKIIFAEVPRRRLFVTINIHLMQNVMNLGQGSYLSTPTLAGGVLML